MATDIDPYAFDGPHQIAQFITLTPPPRCSVSPDNFFASAIDLESWALLDADSLPLCIWVRVDRANVVFKNLRQQLSEGRTRW